MNNQDYTQQIIDPLPETVQESIDAYARYYAEHHKLGMSIRQDMQYVASVAMRAAVATLESALAALREDQAEREKAAREAAEVCANIGKEIVCPEECEAAILRHFNLEAK